MHNLGDDFFGEFDTLYPQKKTSSGLSSQEDFVFLSRVSAVVRSDLVVSLTVGGKTYKYTFFGDRR